MVCENHDKLLDKIEKLSDLIIKIDTKLNNGMSRDIENSRDSIKDLYEKRENDMLELERIKAQLKLYGIFIIPFITGVVSFSLQRFFK